MKKLVILILVLALFLIAGCTQQQVKPAETAAPAEQAEEKQACTEMWICANENTKAYRKSDCDFNQITNCPSGCENGNCREAKAAEEPKLEEKKEVAVENKSQPEQEKAEVSEDEQLKQIFGYSKTRLTSYSYKYKDPAGPQYRIYVKGNKLKIDYISDVKQVYLDTQKKTAEEYCISHTKCGKIVGKIADLDYNKAYIETPIDWLAKITEAKKIDEGFYLGKKSWALKTNIGEVEIDSYYGFIYSIEQSGKAYSFTEAAFNVVKDTDVNVPDYLLPK